MSAIKYITQGAIINAATTEQYRSGITASELRRDKAPDPKLYNSKLGTPVLADITVPAFEYTVDGITYYVPEFKSYECLISVNSSKNIVKTVIQGLKGTVKEYISDGDDMVVIDGIITGQNGNYPFEAVQDLKKLVAAPVAFKITSRYLQNLDIDTLVIEGSEINQEEGGYSYQKFKLYCVTDIPIELNIISSSNTTAE